VAIKKIMVVEIDEERDEIITKYVKKDLKSSNKYTLGVILGGILTIGTLATNDIYKKNVNNEYADLLNESQKLNEASYDLHGLMDKYGFDEDDRERLSELIKAIDSKKDRLEQSDEMESYKSEIKKYTQYTSGGMMGGIALAVVSLSSSFVTSYRIRREMKKALSELDVKYNSI
jgi:hypothetical protein